LCDELIFDVPVGFLDHVGKEYGLDLIQQEYLGDSFEHFIDGVLEGNVATSSNGT
jgi:DhnA family fructose-bisphosphate aldolase class Ia